MRAYVISNTVIHDATIDGDQVVADCGRTFRRRDPKVYTAKEFQTTPAIMRHKANCRACLIAQHKERLKLRGTSL